MCYVQLKSTGRDILGYRDSMPRLSDTTWIDNVALSFLLRTFQLEYKNMMHSLAPK